MAAPQIKFRARTPFAQALKQRVDAYFAVPGRSRGGGQAILRKTAILFAWLGTSYACLWWLHGSWWGLIAVAVSCGLAAAGLGMAVQHDGGHLAYSTSRRINRAAASVLDFLGASSHVWRLKHTIVHHTFPNVEGVDDDLDAAPFARLAPGQRRRWGHRLQHYYMWPLYGFLTAKWFFYDDFRDIARGHVGDHVLHAPRGFEGFVFFGGKLLHLAWAILLPAALLGWAQGLAFYALMAGSCGFTLAIVFQLAHCTGENEFVSPSPGLRLDFAEHQLASTVDFARNNRALNWYAGGLNYQAVHHLFPRVSHLHYPALSRIVEATADEFGVRYFAAQSFRSALSQHYRWLKKMGSPAAPVESYPV